MTDDIDRDIAKLKGETCTIDEAVALLEPGPSALTIRHAIRDGKLNAIYPGGRDPKKLGRGVKIRIYKRELQEWWFGVAPR